MKEIQGKEFSGEISYLGRVPVTETDSMSILGQNKLGKFGEEALL